MDVLTGLRGAFCFWRPRKPMVPFSVILKKFKNILALNNRSLELMADMGDKLGGEYVFDRQYILDACERVSDQVFKLISDLGVLSQRKNIELFMAFERIRHEIQEELAGRHTFPSVSPALLLEDLNGDLCEEAGNKLAILGDLRNILGLPVPDGFVITTKAFFDFLEHNDLRRHIEIRMAEWDGEDEAYLEALSQDIRRRILAGEVPRSVASHIDAMVDILASRHRPGPMFFAVRSSAWGEDTEWSFAGQYDSFLNVPRNGILDAYRKVLASAYSLEAWHYRLHRGYREHEMAMAVGCQLMAEAEVSGALYTYAPFLDEKEAMVVSAAWGLGPAVVDGTAEVDTYYLDRTPPHNIQSSDIACKISQLVPLCGGGTDWTTPSENVREIPCLTPRQLEQLAQTAIAIERYYKRPQDVEWAFDKQGNLSVLQTRPLNIRPQRREYRCCLETTHQAPVIFSGRGTVVQRGIATGKVFLAGSHEDIGQFPNGAILVTRHTSPRFSRIMRKARGIITDVGSATGHMATVAREYRVPTIVDTGVATLLLKTGDEITLDATENVVYRGEIPELCRFELTEEDSFEECYEYRLLRRVLKKISPLNLIDSRSEDFKPSRGRTYHDLTRYVHEKAVEELVSLSECTQRHQGTRPMRLESAIPLGLLIIDAEDGTCALHGAESLTSDDIVSVPMKAFLDGVSDVGMWATDPVAVDFSSFFSSVTRTFSSSLASPQDVGRNLAVVSKEYMNLNLRLGYHFNTVDAYISDSLNDNYIYFRFLGGVTDVARRSRRARLVGEILERFDFLVEIHGDLVVGRVKKLSRTLMVEKMRMLGGLIGYARQLDVRMRNDAQMAYYLGDFMNRVATTKEACHGCVL